MDSIRILICENENNQQTQWALLSWYTLLIHEEHEQ